MYISFKEYFFYKLKKILSTIFRFDSSWRLATIFCMVISFGVLIFSPLFAQTNTSTSQVAGCGNITSTLSDFATAFTITFAGSSGCDGLTSSARNSNSGDFFQKAFPAPSVNADGTPTGYDPSLYRYGGAISASMALGGSLVDLRPASTYDAVTVVAKQAGFVNAQVSGFNQFAPITPLWGLFRNIALLMFVVVFVAIGFFILIQRKMGGQETVSLVSGIVNASVAMIVIAFSYAIGGFLVDIFINIANGVVASTFNDFINSREILDKLNIANSGVNILTLMNELSNIGVSQSAANLFQGALTGLAYPAQSVKDVFSGFGGVNAGPFPVGAAIGFFSSAFVDILMGIINSGFNHNSLINAIIAFVIFIIMIRVVFAMLGAYISIVFKIMFAPFILLPAALPGNAGKVVMSWILSLIASCLTFPAIFACILMSAMFLNLNANISDGTKTGSDGFNYFADCNYNSQLNPTNQGVIQGNTRPSTKFVVTRLGDDGKNPATGKFNTNSFGEHSQCYPLALPGKFNVWPAPFGNLQGVEPDDLIRFVIALAFIVITPSVPKIIQQMLKVPQDNLLAGVSQGLRSGSSAFSQFISAVPSFGVGRAIGSITKGASDAAQ
jgi:hypothetical protein